MYELCAVQSNTIVHCRPVGGISNKLASISVAKLGKILGKSGRCVCSACAFFLLFPAVFPSSDRLVFAVAFALGLAVPDGFCFGFGLAFAFGDFFLTAFL